MPIDQRTTDKTEIFSAADNDWIEVIQVSDTSGNAAGTTKKIQKSNLVSQAPTTFTSLTDVNETTLVGEDGKVPFVKAGTLNLQKLPTFEDLLGGNSIIRGGFVYISGLTYNVWSTFYLINGVPINSPVNTNITSANGDATHPRIDVFAIEVLDLANPSPTVVKIEGTPSASPAKPVVNLETQVEVSFITVAAAATLDANAVTEKVYDENTGESAEWDATDIPASANMADNTDPKIGTVAISLPAYTSDILEFTKATKYTYVANESLIFYMKSPANFTGTTNLKIKLRNSTSLEYYLFTITSSNASNFGFSRAVTTWQLVQIPLSNFVANSNTITQYDELEITFIDTPILSLDWIVIQGGVPNPSTAITTKWIDGDNPLDAVYTDGKVGIGTTAPSRLLHMYEDSTSAAILLMQNTDSSVQIANSSTQFVARSTATEVVLQSASGSANVNSISLTLALTELEKGTFLAPVIRTAAYTVATLPTGTQGDRAYVTDATTPTYLGTLTGGGAVKCPVFYNGSAWVSA